MGGDFHVSLLKFAQLQDKLTEWPLSLGREKKQYWGIFSALLWASGQQASVCLLTSFQPHYLPSCHLYWVRGTLLTSPSSALWPSCWPLSTLGFFLGSTSLNIYTLSWEPWIWSQSGDHLPSMVVSLSQVNYESSGLESWFSTILVKYPHHHWKIPVASLLSSVLAIDKLIPALTTPWRESVIFRWLWLYHQGLKHISNWWDFRQDFHLGLREEIFLTQERFLLDLKANTLCARMGWLSECHTVFPIQTLGFCKGFSGNLPLSFKKSGSILIGLVCRIGALPKIILFVCNIHPKIFAQLSPSLPRGYELFSTTTLYQIATLPPPISYFSYHSIYTIWHTT